ncbi:molybdopterin-dependent oxidoreductase [Arabiibacter massiliensis]|uniref:molybdopterin-dependent oxidoreductase n=1 Tax=Arabiibacter massiliensis TaxID=1870985 RepID=UPI0009BAD038|nr:molybdopterin-dependent oxidoreductase [Arabiibacter massiliensis]
MSGTSNPHGGLTRRGFLKATGAAAGALGLAGAAGMTAADTWLAPTEAHAEPEETVGYTFHQNHCTGHCSLKCTVRDGRLALIEPNDAESYDKRYRIACVRGISEIEHVYSEARIQTPLKRVGERGSGEFVAISWDEALEEIKKNLGDVWSKYGKEAVVVAGTSDVKVRYPHLKQIFNAQQDGRTGIDIGVGNGLGPMIGDSSSFVICTSESRDWCRAKTIILASTNFLESSVPSAKNFFEAQEAGATIISVDTHFTTTAGKADQWVPIEPGTDGALFQGMISCILDNEWYDEASMKTGTSFPFLVNTKTGKLLRAQGDSAGEEGQTAWVAYGDTVSGANTDEKKSPGFMVWDTVSGSAVLFESETAVPALTGQYEIDGSTYTTVFELLKKSQKDNGFTVEWASQKTSIPVETIEDLARRYALETPATISLGWGGSDKYMNSDICGHAAGVLAALTGNYGKPGASVGVHVGGNYSGWSAKLAAWKLPKEYKVAKQEMASYRMRYEDNGVHAYVALGDMFQQHYANMNVTKEWLNTLDFILYIDIYHTTSADWADIVLPACSKFETSEEVESLKVAYGHVLAQGKVLDPLFESKPDLEIERLLAKTMGIPESVLPKSSYEFCEYQLAQSTDPKLKGMTLRSLLDNQGVLPLPGIDEIRETYASQVAKTDSGRFDVYLEKRLEAGQALPVYEDPQEVHSGNALRQKYPLQFYQARTKFQIHSMFCDAAWIKQFYEPHIEMNPVDMEARGLSAGDVVEVFNDRGSMQVKVAANEIVRPGCTRIFEGLWTRHMIKGNLQELTNDDLSPREDILQAGTCIAFQDTLVEVRKA